MKNEKRASDDEKRTGRIPETTRKLTILNDRMHTLHNYQKQFKRTSGKITSENIRKLTDSKNYWKKKLIQAVCIKILPIVTKPYLMD